MNSPFSYPSITKALFQKINIQNTVLFLFYDEKRGEKWNPVDKIKAGASEKLKNRYVSIYKDGIRNGIPRVEITWRKAQREAVRSKKVKDDFEISDL